MPIVSIAPTLSRRGLVPRISGCQLRDLPYLDGCGGARYRRDHDFALQGKSLDRPRNKTGRRGGSFRKNAYGGAIGDEVLHPVLAVRSKAGLHEQILPREVIEDLIAKLACQPIDERILDQLFAAHDFAGCQGMVCGTAEYEALPI